MLGDFQGEIACVDDVLPDAVDFVSEDEGVLPAGLAAEGVEPDGMDRLLDGDQGIACLAEPPDGFQGVSDVFPGHTVLRSEGRLVEFGGRRDGADAAEPDPVGLEGVGRPESGSDVVGAADVVEYQDDAAFREVPVGLRRDASEFDIEQFPVFHGCKDRIFAYICKYFVND